MYLILNLTNLQQGIPAIIGSVILEPVVQEVPGVGVGLGEGAAGRRTEDGSFEVAECLPDRESGRRRLIESRG